MHSSLPPAEGVFVSDSIFLPMSIASLEHPPSLSAHLVIDQSLPPDQLGKYSVADPAFVRHAAAALMGRCVQHNCELPEHVASALRLVNGDRNAIGMADALLAIGDLRRRREIICQMVHAIVHPNGS